MPAPSRSGNSHEFSLERLYAYLIVDDIEVDDSLIAQAKNGDGSSLRKIADIYYKRNEFRKAKEWYHLSAIQNDRSAFYRLGMIYQHGRGVPKNYQQSMLWYLRAHENGCAAATNNIGTLYDKGHGVEKDYGVAFHWYSEAALKGSKIGFYNLGVHYENGLGVEKDMLYALDMYQKSADQGHYKALNNIDRINKDGVYISRAQLGRKY
jgi:TPR repeat protein